MHPVSEQTRKKIADIGGAIREQREACGISQTEVALDIGSDKSRISLIENGAVDPRLSTVIDLCGAVGMGLDEAAAPKERKEEPLPQELLFRISKIPEEKKESFVTMLSNMLDMIGC